MPTLGQIVMSTLLAEHAAASGGSQAFGIAMWIGLGVLTVSMMVLMRTRWGQAQPLSKCVALSVFAHVLFIAYAYGTRLIFDTPAPAKDETIRISFVTDMDDDFDAPDANAPQDQVPSQFALMADDPTVAEAMSEESNVPQDEPLVEPPAEASASAREMEPAAIEPAEQQQESAAIEPLPIELAASEPLADETPATEWPPQAQQTPTDEAAAIPELVEVPTADPAAEAVVAVNDAPKPSAGDFDANVDAVSPTTEYPDNRSIASPPVVPITPVPAPAGQSTRVADGTPLPRPYQNRQAQNRLALAKRNGASERTEHAVEAALKWLARHQAEDGRWDVDQLEGGRETKVLGHDRKGAGMNADTGITGLALLAFLSAGHTHFEGEYRRNVQHGLEFILGEQATDGNLAGASSFFARMYCHGMATLAICEAYAMTGDQRMKPFVEQAVGYTITSQDPVSGGWRYQPSDRGDMSQFGWQVMALKSAELAGIKIPGETRSGMIRFLRSVAKGDERGLASYRPSERASETMTAEALACRFFLGIRQDDGAIDEATSYLHAKLPSSGKANLYYWYYGTLALFQTQGLPSSRVATTQPTVWPEWNQALQQQLLAKQQRSGDDAGSFSPDTVWGSYGGRVYSTAMATLCLEVYYRYLPLYEPPAAAAAASRNVIQYRTLR